MFLEEKLEMIKILQMTSGTCGKIQKGAMTDRFALMPHYSRLIALPIPHTNLISMIG